MSIFSRAQKRRIGMVLSYARAQEGQLLVEMLVALVIGGLLTLTASVALVALVRYNFENEGSQAAGALAYNLMSSVASFAQSDWHNIYDLNKTSASPYYLVLNPTSSIAVAGDESVFFNDIQSGLIGQWKFDESTGTVAYDSSGNGRAATLVTGITRVASSSCLAGGCLGMSGAGYVLSPDIGAIPTSTTITVWVLPSAAGGVVVSELGQAAINTGWHNSQIEVEANNTIKTCVWTGSETCVTAGTGIVYGQWYLVALRYDASSGTLTGFVNGVAGDSTVAAKQYPPALYYAIGASDANNGGNGDYFTGSVDDMRVYNRALSASEISLLYNNKPYTRYFYVDNVSRDGSGNIVTGSGTDDPSTQMVHSVVSWEGGRTVAIGQYFTRSREEALYQGGWQGGSGQTGPLTGALTGYDTSSNIIAQRTVTLATTTASGTLTSSIFDTQISGGAAINSLMWQGELNGGSAQFQFAYSNSSSGPWNFYGPGASSLTYYTPTNSGVPLAVTDIHNYRYFRYEIFLTGSGTTTPVVSGVSVGWSP